MTKSKILVDSHCHVDLYTNPLDVMEKAARNNVLTIAVTNAPSVYFYTRNMAERFTFMKPGIGLHPELVYLKSGELAQMWSHLEETRFVGEIGLDYSAHNLSDKRQQREVFDAILDRCSRYGDKVITVHSRAASEDVVNAIGSNYPGKIILHWYTGRIKDLEQAISCGMYFSINSNMTSSKRGRELIKRMPRTRIVTETDGPFTTIGTKRRPSEPTDVLEAVRGLATIWDMTLDEVQELVQENAVEILGPELFMNSTER